MAIEIKTSSDSKELIRNECDGSKFVCLNLILKVTDSAVRRSTVARTSLAVAHNDHEKRKGFTVHSLLHWPRPLR